MLRWKIVFDYNIIYCKKRMESPNFVRLKCEKKKNLYKLKKNPIYVINIVHNFVFT